MANGDRTLYDRREMRAKLLDGQVASASGPWVEVPQGYVYRSWEATSLSEGATNATVDLMVSNAETQPATATDGPITQTLTTTTQGAAKTESYRWVKAKKTQGTTPVATTVTMLAARSG